MYECIYMFILYCIIVLHYYNYYNIALREVLSTYMCHTKNILT